MGIEPTSEAWEASILPLYDARSPTPDPIIHNCNLERKELRVSNKAACSRRTKTNRKLTRLRTEEQSPSCR
jgi:hypothetical protein